MPASKTSTHQKALAINLDPKIYGSIAEIGAGQEVARWFFHVGGAAGTVAKSISAYDKEVSDELYGKGTRYVSRERVESMLLHEFNQVQSSLGDTKGSDTAFFSFADSVSARNYAGTNKCHGWMGLRFQRRAGGEANQIMLHVNMHDVTNALQQEALGVLGVNLLYGSFFIRDSHQAFLVSLLEGLSPERLEIDAIYFSGPDLKGVTPIELGGMLIAHSLAQAVLIEKSGDLSPPSEAFYNRPVLVLRGRTDRASLEQETSFLKAGLAQLTQELEKDSKEPASILEITLSSQTGAETNLEGLLEFIPKVRASGNRLLLTQFRQNYFLTEYLRRHSPDAPIRFVLDVASLVQLFQKRHYEAVAGDILEGTGRFFAQNVKVYVKALEQESFRSRIAGHTDTVIPDSGPTVSLQNLELAPPIGHLFHYLRSIEGLVPLA